jgi:hypothetical protein
MKQNVLRICKAFASVAGKSSYDLEAHVSSAKHTHTQTQICHNAPKVNEYFIIQNSNTEKRAMAIEGALSFHAVKHCTGENYCLHCPIFSLIKSGHLTVLSCYVPSFNHRSPSITIL